MSSGTRYYKLPEQRGDRAIEWWFVKVVETEQGPVFDAYVGLDRNGRVIERSSGYGVFEGRAGNLQYDSGTSAADEEEFAAAWHSSRSALAASALAPAAQRRQRRSRSDRVSETARRPGAMSLPHAGLERL